MESEYREAEQAATQAIGIVTENAGEEFRAAAFRTGVMLARNCSEFTSVELRDAMPEGVGAHDDRALGGIMRKLSTSGVIGRTERTRRSAKRRNHNRPVRVWKSLLYPRGN